MLKRALTILLIFFLATGQLVLGQWLTWWTPEFVLIAILVIGLFGDAIETIWWVVLGGLLLDLTIGSPTGFYLISFSCAGLLVTVLNKQVFQQPSPLVAAGVCLVVLLLFELLLAFMTDTLSVWLVWRSLISTVIAGVAYALLFYFGSRQEVVELG